MEIRIPFIDLTSQTRDVLPEFSAQVQELANCNRFIGGEPVENFESGFAAYCGASHCVALNSGTDALRLGLLASGIGSGDEVITTPFTFIATAEAISQTGASLILADIEPDTFNLCPQAAERCISPRTKALLPVHIFGLPADMEKLTYLAHINRLSVFEDASQAQGAEIAGQRAGSLGGWAAFSFYPTKNLGAFGDAGALTCQDPQLARKVRLLRNHGQDGHYQHCCEGYNSRMDALQAALLSLKLARLEAWIEQRRTIAAIYREELNQVSGVRVQAEPQRYRHSYHIVAALVEKRDDLQRFLTSRGIETKVIYPTPIHLLQAYRHLDLPQGQLPVCEDVCRKVLCFPAYPGMSEEQAGEVARSIKGFYAG